MLPQGYVMQNRSSDDGYVLFACAPEPPSKGDEDLWWRSLVIGLVAGLAGVCALAGAFMLWWVTRPRAVRRAVLWPCTSALCVDSALQRHHTGTPFGSVYAAVAFCCRCLAFQHRGTSHHDSLRDAVPK